LTMRKITLLVMAGLLFSMLAGCGEVETREKILPDGSKAVVDAAGEIVSEDKSQVLERYTYDEQSGRYINETTGIWYVVDNGYKLIPPEQYFDPKEVGVPDGINISGRPVDVWELSEIREITIQPGDTLVGIINPYFMNEHFRMNYEWYAKQVLELNNITDPHYIRAGDTLKIPILIDKGTE